VISARLVRYRISALSDLHSESDGAALRIGRQAMQEKSQAKARHAEPCVLGALSDTRIVALMGPRR